MRLQAGCATIRAVKRWFVALVWLLTLALPLQGLAVAAPSMGFGSMHDVPPLSDTTDAHGVKDAGADVPCHGVDPSTACGSTSVHAGCAQCAVCHAGVAPMPQTGATPRAVHQREAPPGWTPPALSTVDLAGLDRPPRSHRG